MKGKKKSDKYVFTCPVCGAVEERRERNGVVCTECFVFMDKVIKSNAFEDTDATQEA